MKGAAHGKVEQLNPPMTLRPTGPGVGQGGARDTADIAKETLKVGDGQKRASKKIDALGDHAVANMAHNPPVRTGAGGPQLGPSTRRGGGKKRKW